MTNTIQNYYDSILFELNSNCSKQRKRHLESELEMLDVYLLNHSNDEKVPTYLELFCELNPNSPECRIYDV